jgi:hypothetical protein
MADTYRRVREMASKQLENEAEVEELIKQLVNKNSKRSASHLRHRKLDTLAKDITSYYEKKMKELKESQEVKMEQT